MTVTDPMEFALRAEAVNVRIDEIVAESRRINLSLITPADVAKLEALNAEADLLLANIHAIRHEQIAWQLGEHPDQQTTKARRPWWRFWG